MLFLLGLDAILSGNTSSVSNYLIIPREYVNSSNETIPYRYFEIFDNIYEYLSNIGAVEDLDNYLRFDCNGLKLLINDITGTGNDRTVPVLFNNDINKKIIDVTKQSYRIPESDRINLSYYDIQAIIINNIFEDAGYNGEPYDIIPTDSAYETASVIKSHNSVVTSINDERVSNSNIFKLLDFKSMYSYALGVLYGCRCLGYNNLFIWRLNPSLWYDGVFKNLVSTAWSVFRFYKSAYIEEFEEDPDLSVKYQSIAYNKLWNFDDKITRQSLQSNPIMIDEIESYIFSLKLVDQGIEEQFPNPDSSLINYLVQSSPTYYSQRLLGNSIAVSDIAMYLDDMVIRCFGSNIPIDGNFEWELKIKANDEVIKTYTVITKEDCIDETRYQVVHKSAVPPIIEDTIFDDILATVDPIYEADPTTNVQLTAAVTVNETSIFDEVVILTLVDEYSYVNDRVTPAGKYLIINDDSVQWDNITNLLYDQTYKYGIVSKADIENPIIRYLGKDKITIYKSYTWDKDESFYCNLSPDNKRQWADYFIPDGAVGWVDFDRTSISASSGNLSIVPVEYSLLDQDRIHTVDTSRGKISYYECIIGGSDEKTYYIYGVFDSALKYDDVNDKYLFNNVSDHFKYILSKDLFNKYYEVL
jgi:hypothetical protein